MARSQVNVIDGIVVAGEGDDVILFGRRHRDSPDLELRDLLVSLRSASATSTRQRQSPISNEFTITFS